MTQPQVIVFPQKDLVAPVRDIILQLVGCGSTMQAVGQGMQTTPLEKDDTFCPEIFVRVMGSEVSRQTDAALTAIEELEWSIDDIVKTTPSQPGGWIKITTKTLPKDGVVVLVWSPLLGRSEPAFYVRESKSWCRAFDNGSTLLLDPAIEFFRFDSGPIPSGKKEAT